MDAFRETTRIFEHSDASTRLGAPDEGGARHEDAGEHWLGGSGAGGVERRLTQGEGLIIVVGQHE